MDSNQYDSDDCRDRDGIQSFHSYYDCGDPLAVIYNEGLWRINKVSPLCNFEYRAVKLKQYASQIRQAIVSSVTTKTSTSYKVQMSARPRLKYVEDEPDGLEIKVMVEGDLKNRDVYKGILLSWGLNITFGDSNLLNLPFLLDRGEEKISTAVKTTLQNTFSCNIIKFSFPQYQLLTVGFSFLEVDTSNNTDKFVLSYTIPNSEVKDKIDITFDIGFVKAMWNRLRNEYSKNSELSHAVYKMLCEHVRATSLMDISKLNLNAVLLPKAENDGSCSLEVNSQGVFGCCSPQFVDWEGWPNSMASTSKLLEMKCNCGPLR